MSTPEGVIALRVLYVAGSIGWAIFAIGAWDHYPVPVAVAVNLLVLGALAFLAQAWRRTFERQS